MRIKIALLAIFATFSAFCLPAAEKFKPYSGNPILAVEPASEPSVWVEGDSLRMAFSTGWDASSAIMLANSFHALDWSQGSATTVIGNGAGAEAHWAVRSTLIKAGSQYRIYYADSGENIRLATSEDGKSFARQPGTV